MTDRPSSPTDHHRLSGAPPTPNGNRNVTIGCCTGGPGRQRMRALPVSRGPGGPCRAVWHAVGITCAGRAATSIEQSAGRLGDDQILPRRDAQDGRTQLPRGRQDGIALPASPSDGERPSIPSRPTIRARTGAACSPIPPVKTSPSRRGSAVAAAAIPRAALRTNSSIGELSVARRLPRRDRAVRACRRFRRRRGGRIRARGLRPARRA